MTSHDTLVLAGGGFAGLAAGGLYFGALWLTTQRAVRSRRPLRLLGASALVRLVPLLIVFSLLVRWHLLAALAGLAGFLAARLFWVRTAGGGQWS